MIIHFIVCFSLRTRNKHDTPMKFNMVHLRISPWKWTLGRLVGWLATNHQIFEPWHMSHEVWACRRGLWVCRPLALGDFCAQTQRGRRKEPKFRIGDSKHLGDGLGVKTVREWCSIYIHFIYALTSLPNIKMRKYWNKIRMKPLPEYISSVFSPEYVQVPNFGMLLQRRFFVLRFEIWTGSSAQFFRIFWWKPLVVQQLMQLVVKSRVIFWNLHRNLIKMFSPDIWYDSFRGLTKMATTNT